MWFLELGFFLTSLKKFVEAKLSQISQSSLRLLQDTETLKFANIAFKSHNMTYICIKFHILWIYEIYESCGFLGAEIFLTSLKKIVKAKLSQISQSSLRLLQDTETLKIANIVQ